MGSCQCDLSLIDELHDHRCGEGLRDGGDTVLHLRTVLQTARGVGQTEPAGVQQLAILGHNHGTAETAIDDILFDETVDAGRQVLREQSRYTHQTQQQGANVS